MRKIIFPLLCVSLTMEACNQQSQNINDTKLKAVIDSIAQRRVKREVQIGIYQYMELHKSDLGNSNYRSLAREEAERAAGQHAQDRQRQEDAILNSQQY